LFKLLSKTQNSHVKNHVDAKTTITGQTILSCKNEIGMPRLHSKITAATTTGFFRLAEFFSGGFSANAENIQLGG